METELQQSVEVILLGSAQDGGFPQVGCQCGNCKEVYSGLTEADPAVSLAVIDRASRKWWLFEASPQLNEQWRRFAGTLMDFELSGQKFDSSGDIIETDNHK